MIDGSLMKETRSLTTIVPAYDRLLLCPSDGFPFEIYPLLPGFLGTVLEYHLVFLVFQTMYNMIENVLAYGDIFMCCSVTLRSLLMLEFPIEREEQRFQSIRKRITIILCKVSTEDER